MYGMMTNNLDGSQGTAASFVEAASNNQQQTQNGGGGAQGNNNMQIEQQSDDHSSNNSNSGNDPAQKTNLIINYLPQNMTEEEIKSLFSRVGEVDSLKLVRDKTVLFADPLNPGAPKGQSLGYGFVNFRRAQDAEQAITVFNGLRLQNKTIKVSYARPSSESIKGANLYVSGLPKTMTQEELEAIFAPYGTIITSRILTNAGKETNTKGVGFIRFDKKDEANHAIQSLNNTIPQGCVEPISVKFSNVPGTNKVGIPPVIPTFMNPMLARKFSGPVHNSINKGLARFSPMSGDAMIDAMFPRAPKTIATVTPGGGWNIFVYNIAPETEENTLWELFGPFGAVQSVKLVKDAATNQCKGYGFITMTNYEEATMAIRSLNGYTLAGRVLQVSFKTNKSK